MTSDTFMPLSLDAMRAANAYSASAKSSSPTVEEVEDMGYTVSDPSEDLGLDFTDFLQLMVAQLQNQTIDNATDTSDMLNQLVQMSVVSMMSSVKTSLDTLADASTLTYAASLVGKTVTVGSYNEDGGIEEIVGEVTGTGTYQDTPVIFVNNEMYPLSSIMAVGKLPPAGESGESSESGEAGGEESQPQS